MAKSPIPNEDLGKPIPYDPNFTGPLKNRSCTDILCLLLFVVFILVWIGIGAFAYASGNPEVLLVPRDSNGSRCGLDSHVKSRPYLMFFDLTKCIGPEVPFTGCKTTQLCVDKCPTEFFIYKEGITTGNKWLCVDGITTPPKDTAEKDKLVKDGLCASWYVPSVPFLNRCLYNVADKDLKGFKVNRDNVKAIRENLETSYKWISLFAHFGISFFTDNPKAHQVGRDVVYDIKDSWKEIVGGIFIGIAFCVIYIAMMRWIAGVMVWVSIIGIVALLAAGVYFTAVEYNYYKHHPEEDPQTFLDTYVKTDTFWLVLLIIDVVILVILLLVLIVLRKRIYLAIALIEEGSKAVSSATSTLIFPIVPWILQIGVILFVISAALYLTTIGNPYYKVRNFDLTECKCTGDALNYKDGDECDPDIFVQNCNVNVPDGKCKAECHFINLNKPGIIPYMHAVNIIGLFWGVCFMTAFGEMVLAATFATWYWTRPRRKIPFFTVSAAVLRTLRYHIGTLAFGSLIIAICKMIRAVLEYIDHKLKKYDNEVTKAILCCLKCFFWCLEKFLKFLNKNAYIMCAIHGKNFCMSAKDAFSLILRNIVRVFVLDKITDFLFFLSKILVTLASSAIIWAIIFYTTKDNYNYYYVPVIFVGIATYFIANMFFNVYSMAVDTLFMCYLEDCERNDGSQEKPYFMSKNLGKIFGKKNKRS